jgi:hypothetical protein
VRQSTKRIEVVAKKLRNLPSAANKANKAHRAGQTPKKAVKTVQDELTALLARGYTVEDIGRVLRGAGIEISAVTLRGYARNAAAPGGAPAKRAASTDASAAPAKPKVAKVATKPKGSTRTASTAGTRKSMPPTSAKARKSTPPVASAAPGKARKSALTPPAATTGSFHDYGQHTKATFVVRPDTPDSDL